METKYELRVLARLEQRVPLHAIGGSAIKNADTGKSYHGDPSPVEPIVDLCQIRRPSDRNFPLCAAKLR